MSTDEITSHDFDQSCRDMADEIVTEILADVDGPDDYSEDRARERLTEAAHEAVDGHSFVIYTQTAKHIAGHPHINTDAGEEFFEELGGTEGMRSPVTLGDIAERIVYGEMRRRVEEYGADLLKERVEALEEVKA